MNTTTQITCSLHLTKNCGTCHKFANECDFGACHRSATHRVIAAVETRRTCAKHVKDVARYYPTSTVEAAA